MKRKEKVKKPLYKKWWFWVVVVILVGAIGSGTSGGNDAESKAQTSMSEPSEMAGDSPDKAVGEVTVEEKRADLENALGGSVIFYDNVRNDSTGRWRVLVFYSAENIVDHGAEYYDAYFSSDDEVHMAVNLGLKTTSVMTVSAGMMAVDVHEYVDGEEHDAKALGSGDLLKQYMIDLKTGEIEDLDQVVTDDGEGVSLADMEAAISAALPAEYQSSRWFDVNCDYNNAGISAFMQVDQGNSDADAALFLAADCFALAKSVVEENDATLASVVVTVVDNGAAVGIYSTENGKDFTVINNGKRTEAVLP